MIDTHCHLNFKAFNDDLDEVIKRAKNSGIEKIIIPGTDILSSHKALDISLKYPKFCYAAIGIHPHHVHDPNLKIDNDLKSELAKLIKKGGESVVAIGEIGLDFHVYKQTKYQNNFIDKKIINKQIDLLNLQLDLAYKFNLPTILHCREAWPDMIQTISAYATHYAEATRVEQATADKSAFKYNSRNSLPPTNYIKHNHDLVKTNYIKPHRFHGVFHCFTGSTQDLSLLITMGYLIGFDGNITYSDNSSTLVKQTPLNRLLLETDSPYLAPIPFRGQRNEPKNINLIAQTVAKIHSTSLPAEAQQNWAKVGLSEVIHLSTNNAKSLFSF